MGKSNLNEFDFEQPLPDDDEDLDQDGDGDYDEVDIVPNEEKLEELAELEGFDDYMDLIEAFATDSVCPGICKNCDYTTEVEPDQSEGWCENCETNTVVSAMIMAGII